MLSNRRCRRGTRQTQSCSPQARAPKTAGIVEVLRNNDLVRLTGPNPPASNAGALRVDVDRRMSRITW
jgi:hypothetical protein